MWESLSFSVYLTLCDLMNSSPPVSSAHGILQARILEWIVIPSPGDIPKPEIKPRSSKFQADSLPSESPCYILLIPPNCSEFFFFLLCIKKNVLTLGFYFTAFLLFPLYESKPCVLHYMGKLLLKRKSINK